MRPLAIALVLVGCGAARVPAETRTEIATAPATPIVEPAPIETCAALVERGIAAEGQGEIDDARAAYQRAIELEPRCVSAIVDLARLARRAEPGSAEAESLLARAIERSERSLEALDQLALVHLERDQLDLADGVIDRALAIDPDHAIAHETRGLVAMRRGDIHAALAAFTRAIDLAPSFEALMNRASLELEFRDHAAAERDYRAATDLRPESYEAWLGLGAALREENRIDDARIAFERARATDPARAEAYYELGVLFADFMGGTREERTEAQRLFRHFVDRARGRPELATQVEEVERTCGCDIAQRQGWRRDRRGRRAVRARLAASSCMSGRIERVTCACHGADCGVLMPMQREAEAMQRLIEGARRTGAPATAASSPPSATTP